MLFFNSTFFTLFTIFSTLPINYPMFPVKSNFFKISRNFISKQLDLIRPVIESLVNRNVVEKYYTEVIYLMIAFMIQIPTRDF